jgi:hypothetical protein
MRAGFEVLGEIRGVQISNSDQGLSDPRSTFSRCTVKGRW